MPEIKSYGSWKSPITSDLIVQGSIRLGEVQVDGADVYWIEGRAAEKGRNVIVRRTPDGNISDVTPAPFSARTRVHEYGGGAYIVRDGKIFFVNFADQILYEQKIGEAPIAFSPPELELARYADFVVEANHSQLICVCEDHCPPETDAEIEIATDPLLGQHIEFDATKETGTNHPTNSIVSFKIGAVHTDNLLASDADFYAAPRLSPDGTKLCWMQWNHPNMPWDATELYVGEFAEDGSLTNIQLVAGGYDVSICQPEWSPDGILHFVADQTGWWNLYRYVNGKVEALCPMQAEFGVPHWVFRQSQYAFIDATHIICAYIENGFFKLGVLDTEAKQFEKIETPFTYISNVRATASKAYFIAASATESSAVIEFDLALRTFTTLKKSSDLKIDTGYVSVAQAVEFPTENDLTAHAFYYPPTNQDFAAPEGELPPVIVEIHGGPTSATYAAFGLGVQYWTSRGFGILDVNYGGSTGYGRSYRERLRNNWGVVDVDDCVNGAKYLVAQGLADPKRLCITGGSAGGYTTLAALAFRDIFSAGASHYGVSDLQALDDDTHKFEAQYTFGLVPKEFYRERSPIHHTRKLNAPVIFFQGLEDKIVLPNQAEMMVDALRKKGLPVAYVAFAEEGHGFRQAANIKRALDGELYFYSRVFGFALADEVEPVMIENL